MILAHMDMKRVKQTKANELDGDKQLERGQDVDGQWAWQAKIAAGTQPAEQATAGGHSQRTLRPAQASNKRPQMAGLAAKQQLPQTMSCRAGKWGKCRGTGSHEGGCRPTYTCPYPTYRLCLSLSLPTPLI